MRGVVILRTENGGVAEQATEVRQLMEKHRRDALRGSDQPRSSAARWPTSGSSTSPGAQKGFTATLAAFGGHTLAGVERRRAEELAAGDYRLEGVHRRRAACCWRSACWRSSPRWSAGSRWRAPEGASGGAGE